MRHSKLRNRIPKMTKAAPDAPEILTAVFGVQYADYMRQFLQDPPRVP